MLEQIGLPVGPRAKVLAAIAHLKKLPQLRDDEIRSTPGERRQITVMFCDIVESTKLASRLDPEDFGKLIHTYQRTCDAVVARYEGHVAQYVGDGIESLFGWPLGQEDAAERAVRAGLDILEALKTSNVSEPFSVRIGIATGIVVVGRQEFLVSLRSGRGGASCCLSNAKSRERKLDRDFRIYQPTDSRAL